MIQFIYQYDKNSEKISVELSADSTLTEVLDAFSRFLKAASYQFDGEIMIMEEGEVNESTIEKN